MMIRLHRLDLMADFLCHRISHLGIGITGITQRKPVELAITQQETA